MNKINYLAAALLVGNAVVTTSAASAKCSTISTMYTDPQCTRLLLRVMVPLEGGCDATTSSSAGQCKRLPFPLSGATHSTEDRVATTFSHDDIALSTNDLAKYDHVVYLGTFTSSDCNKASLYSDRRVAMVSGEGECHISGTPGEYEKKECVNGRVFTYAYKTPDCSGNPHWTFMGQCTGNSGMYMESFCVKTSPFRNKCAAGQYIKHNLATGATSCVTTHGGSVASVPVVSGVAGVAGVAGAAGGSQSPAPVPGSAPGSDAPTTPSSDGPASSRNTAARLSPSIVPSGVAGASLMALSAWLLLCV